MRGSSFVSLKKQKQLISRAAMEVRSMETGFANVVEALSPSCSAQPGVGYFLGWREGREQKREPIIGWVKKGQAGPSSRSTNQPIRPLEPLGGSRGKAC